MKFLVYTGDDPRSWVVETHDSYNRYLRKNQHLFPKGAFEFATADWHYDPSDNRCPHDSWVETFEIEESRIAPSAQLRRIDIRLTLLGAYHDGKLRLKYKGVKAYALSLAKDELPLAKAHGDWLIDEVTLSEDRSVLHEIKFRRNGRWLIECDDIDFEWIPIESR